MPVFSTEEPDLGLDGGKNVCVMDASTYVGFYIVQGLLQKGYTVKAAVQNGGNVESLMKMEGERLKIVYADVLDYHSIVDVLRGCSGLFYTFDPPQYDEMMAEIEVRAAHNVLEACAQTDAMERVVFTSSVAAVVWNDDRNSITDFHERHWSDVNLCRKMKLWYALSKTLSERTAWALAMDRELNMVSINAALVIGPPSTYKTPGSTVAYLRGAAQMYENGVLASADVKFVADAHICAYEDPSAYGRYICFNQIINSAEHADDLAKSLRPLISFPERCEDPNVYQQRLSNKKLTGLMDGYKQK